MCKVIIGVMGAGAGATSADVAAASALGRAIAAEGWVLLTGGRAAGVMAAASRGAKEVEGLTVGILPGKDRDGVAAHVDIAICTGLGNARNNINVLSADVVIAIGQGVGTTSEVALALKNHKPVLLWQPSAAAATFFTELAPEGWQAVQTVPEAIARIKKSLAEAMGNT